MLSDGKGKSIDLSRQSSSLACEDVSVGGVSGSVADIDTVSRPGLEMVWQRERCWYTVNFDLMVSCSPVHVSPSSACTFTCKMDHPAIAYLWDHVISGQALLPGSAFMELGYSSVACALRDSMVTN